MMELLQDTHVWFAISFAGFAVLAWFLARPKILGALDAKIAKIREEITVAENLKRDAEHLMAEYQAKQHDAGREAQRILKHAQKNVEQIYQQAEMNIADTMQRREKQLNDRLERMKQNAMAEIQQYAADLATRATAEIIAEKLDKKANENLVDRAIAGLGKNLG